MPGSSGNSSFIPKRGTSKHKRKIHKGKVYSLTIVSYVLLFAALAASAAVYIYSGVVRAELENEAKAMNEAIGIFKESDMKRVQEFDMRLRQANQRLNNSVSVSSIFAALEMATIDTIRFNNFTLKRNLDEGFVVQASIETDTFDSTIFQRGLYGVDETIEAIEIDDLVIKEEVSEDGESVGQTVNFTALMAVPLSAVPYRGNIDVSNRNVETPAPEPQPAVEEGGVETDSEAASGEEVVETEQPVESEEEVSDNQTGV